MRISNRSVEPISLCYRSRKSRLVIAMAGVSMVAESLNAQVNWTNPAGGTYQVASNWAGGTVPDNTLYAGFQGDLITTGTINFTGSVTTLGVSMTNTTGTITFDVGAGNKWTLNQFAIMGQASGPVNQAPSFILPSGEMEASLFLIGNDVNATGHVTVTGLNTIMRCRGVGGAFQVGVYGANSTMLVENGGQVISAGGGWVGLQSGHDALMTIKDPGTKVTVATTMTVAGGNESPVDGGNCRLDILNGGEMIAGRILVGVGNTTSSTNNDVRISGAGSKMTLTGLDGTNSTAASVGFRYGGNEFLVENDGHLITTAGDFRIGAGTFVDGGDILRITGGTITMAGNGDLDPTIQGPEKGRLNITNGTFRMEGGVSTFPAILANVNTAVVDLRGGTAIVKNALINNGTTLLVGDGTSSIATYRMSDPAATHTFSNGLDIRADGRLEGAAIIAGNVSNNGLIAPGSGAGTTKIIGEFTNNTAGGAKVDLANNGLVIDWTATNPTSAIRSSIANARNTGTMGLWSGAGITSSLAQADNQFAIGYADNAHPAFLLTTFLGRDVDPTTTLVRFTIDGDANLDGVTDIGDFSLLAANFNENGEWADGDFDYSGVTDIGDFALLAANFNESVAARRAVPEPVASAVILGVGCLFSRTRRR